MIKIDYKFKTEYLNKITTMSASVYYNCLPLPQEIERIVWFYKEAFEFTDNLKKWHKEHKWTFSLCRWDIYQLLDFEYNGVIGLALGPLPHFDYEMQVDIYKDALYEIFYRVKEPPRDNYIAQHEWKKFSYCMKEISSTTLLDKDMESKEEFKPYIKNGVQYHYVPPLEMYLRVGPSDEQYRQSLK